MNSPQNKDPLAGVLNGWRVTPLRDSRFRAAVWARIETSRGEASWPAYLRRHLPLAAGLMTLALVLGGWIGREQAQSRVKTDRARLAENYVRSLDARTMRLP